MGKYGVPISECQAVPAVNRKRFFDCRAPIEPETQKTWETGLPRALKIPKIRLPLEPFFRQIQPKFLTLPKLPILFIFNHFSPKKGLRVHERPVNFSLKYFKRVKSFGTGDCRVFPFFASIFLAAKKGKNLSKTSLRVRDWTF
jgi:hypothetical protein